MTKHLLISHPSQLEEGSFIIKKIWVRCICIWFVDSSFVQELKQDPWAMSLPLSVNGINNEISLTKWFENENIII